MVLGIFRREDRRPFALYGAIVAQARQAAFYTDFGVADSLDGRFDMVVLHVVLATRRLKGGASSEQQALFDLFISDMDRSLREMGVGDLTVPKRMKVMASAFYGRLEAYGAALDARDGTGLADAIARNVFPEAAASAAPAALAAYMLAAEDMLAATPLETVLAGSPSFPDPESFVVERTP